MLLSLRNHDAESPLCAGRKKPYGFDASALMASCKASIERMSLGLEWVHVRIR